MLARIIISAICIGIVAERVATEMPQCETYIVVMRDDFNTDEEMGNVRRAMEVMSVIVDDFGNVIGPSPPMLVTRDLMGTIIGNMSQSAAIMASNMASVAYVECDQRVTRADAEIDSANFPFPLPPVTPYPDSEILPDLALDEFSYTPDVTLIGAQSGECGARTDRYNLDAIDESCYACNEGTYVPKYTGKNVDVYILDTGIRFDHHDFQNCALTGSRARYAGYDAIDEFQRTNQRGVDCNGHGTHCAGIATGRVSGVAREANVYGIRVLDCNSFGSFGGIIRALDYVLQRHRERIRLPIGDYKGSVVSMSLAGPVSQAVNEAVCRMVAAGVVVVTASGNFRRDACNYSPGSAGCHINVGAHHYTERDTRTCIKDVYWFTSKATSPGFNYGRCVHMMAPGQYVVSASYLDRARTVSMSGTSMACPHVAGACALLLDQFPRASPDMIRFMLIGSSCADIDERRMHPVFRGQTPNRRLRVLRGTPGETTEPTARPTTTTTQTTTTPITTPAPTSPPSCNDRCMFETLASPAVKARFVRIQRIENNYFGFLLRLPFNSRNYIIKKVSTATDENGNNPVWTIIDDQVDTIVDYRFEIGPRFGSVGVDFQDIKSIAEAFGRDFVVNTIIPFRDNKVFALFNKRTACNDNQFIQVNYTQTPNSLVNPITYSNLLGNTATFDVSFTPGKQQFYAHNTLKLEHGSNCECQNRINLNKQGLRNARNIRLDQNLIIVDANSYFVNKNLLFAITLCSESCFTGRGCIASIADNVVVDDMTESNYQVRVRGMKEADYEIIDMAPYYEGGKLYFVGIFIRPKYL